jgi:hypothetical protein
MATYRIETDKGVFEVETDEGAAESAQPSSLEAAARGAAQGLTLGHADEIAGGLEHLATGKPYDQARDESRANFRAAKEAHPVVTGVTEAAASTPAYVAASAGLGPVAGPAAVGAIQGEGNSDAPLLSGDTAKEAALGGAVGAVTGKVGEMVSGALNPSELAATAEEQAAKAAGANSADFRRLGADKIRQAGRTLLDNDVLSPAASTDAMAERVAGLNDEASKTIGAILKRAEGGFDVQSAIRDLDAVRWHFPEDPAVLAKVDAAKEMLRKTAIRGAGDVAGGIENAPEKLTLPFDEANRVKTYLQQKGINWNTDQASQAVDKSIAGTVRRSVDAQLENATPSAEDMRAFHEAKKTFGATENLEDFLGKRSSREFGRSPLSVSDIGAAAVSGHPVAGPTVWKLFRQYGNQNMALVADWLAKNGAAVAGQLGKWGPRLVAAAQGGAESLAVTHYVLSQQDPEYRQQMSEDSHD